jgi:hypothetical protein
MIESCLEAKRRQDWLHPSGDLADQITDGIAVFGVRDEGRSQHERGQTGQNSIQPEYPLGGALPNPVEG